VIRFGAFLWLFCGTAFAAEYRHVTLDNGREVLAEIVTINAEGMNLRLPQGNLIVPPNTPAIFAPLSAAEFEQQQPWKVAILPFRRTLRRPTHESDRYPHSGPRFR
jgi:hypothetical protein